MQISELWCCSLFLVNTLIDRLIKSVCVPYSWWSVVCVMWMQSVRRLSSVHSKSAQRTVQCTPVRRRDILIHRTSRGPTGTGHLSYSSLAVRARPTRSCLLDTTPLSVPPRTLHPAIATVPAIRQPAVPTRQSERLVSTFTLVSNLVVSNHLSCHRG